MSCVNGVIVLVSGIFADVWTYAWPSIIRLETHLMMSLCYGKVNEDTARLALAREMIAVSVLYYLDLNGLTFHWCFYALFNKY